MFEHPVAESVKVKVTSPAALTAITPPSAIVAMLLSELLQTPPVLGIAVIVEFTQVTLDEVVTTGKGCTVIVPLAVAEPQPSGVISYAKVPLCVGVPLMIILSES